MSFIFVWFRLHNNHACECVRACLRTWRSSLEVAEPMYVGNSKVNHFDSVDSMEIQDEEQEEKHHRDPIEFQLDSILTTSYWNSIQSRLLQHTHTRSDSTQTHASNGTISPAMNGLACDHILFRLQMFRHEHDACAVRVNKMLTAEHFHCIGHMDLVFHSTKLQLILPV